MDIDTTLERLRDLPSDPRLAGMESAVLDALASKGYSTPLSGRFIGAVSSLAFMTGVLASAIPGYAEPAPSIVPFGAASVLAPSSLLGTAE